jgi:adenine-specific DNA methylase
VLIEDWLPVAELGIESRRERAAASALPPLSFLHVWWARRPLVACAGALLGSVMPAWSTELASAHSDRFETSNEDAYHAWFLRLCGILGDPIVARKAIDAANGRGEKLKGNGYGYKQAYRNSPENADLALLHVIVRETWGDVPLVIDPTAGGGSVPYEAIRYGLPAIANDLNPVAASVLRAGVELPARYGRDLSRDLRHWGGELVQHVQARLAPVFARSDEMEDVVAYIFARTVRCPRTGKIVPLSPDWWLSRKAGGIAVRLMTHRGGEELGNPEFEIVAGKAIDFDPSKGTVSGGDGSSPWDGLLVSGEYIQAEAKAGRMGSVLYAVSIRILGKRAFRAPTEADLASLAAADVMLLGLVPQWDQEDVLPNEDVPPGNDSRPQRFGMGQWRNMFSPRQRLVHGVFVEEFRRLVPRVRSAIGDSHRADSVLALLATMQAKAVNWNAFLSSWNVGAQGVRSVFDRHDFAFKWTYAEFDGGRALFPWCLSQLLDAYDGIAGLLIPVESPLFRGADLSVPVPAAVTIMQTTAGDLRGVADHSQMVVCIDPPYYTNVMYAELADFFYVWEKRTLGLIWPAFFTDDLTNKKDEAVANVARFADAGRRRNELANADYGAKMTAIFAECFRVMRDDGVLTVMFTHQRAEAWDTLGMSLMETGFAIEASWPVATEREDALNIAARNAATSTIMLVCRKRSETSNSVTFFEDVEGDVRAAARDALARFSAFGIEGVDLLLSTYGPALSVISSRWPVYSSEPEKRQEGDPRPADPLSGRSRLLRPEEALDAARRELVRLQRQRLIGRAAQLDPITDFVLLSWEIFKAREFPFDEARRLALAVGGLDVDELVRAKVIDKKAGMVALAAPARRLRRRGDLEIGLPGIYLDAPAPAVMIDAVHTAMYLACEDGPAAAKAWVDRMGLSDDQRFQAALQGLVNAMPRTKSKDKWDIPEAEWLDAVCFYFPDVAVPRVKMVEEPSQQPTLDLDG